MGTFTSLVLILWMGFGSILSKLNGHYDTTTWAPKVSSWSSCPVMIWNEGVILLNHWIHDTPAGYLDDEIHTKGFLNLHRCRPVSRPAQVPGLPTKPPLYPPHPHHHSHSFQFMRWVSVSILYLSCMVIIHLKEYFYCIDVSRRWSYIWTMV